MAQKLGSALVRGFFFLILPILTFTLGHEALEQRLDSGRPLPIVFIGEKGGTYKCIQTSMNFRSQGHITTLTKVGAAHTMAAHTMQEGHESLDVHDLGGSVTVFVTLYAHQPTKDFFIVASSHFTRPVLATTAILHCFGSKIPPSKPLPNCPTCHVHWSIQRASTIRLNLIANAARPIPQGSSHYRSIPIVRILVLENTAAETKPCTNKKFPAETEPFPAQTKPCAHKKSPAETEPCSHVVHVLPRIRRLLGKLPDVNVHSPASTSNENSWNLDKVDPPSPPAPSGNPPIHE
ncbi:hypothetical protein SLEP1_g58310 [Rubroshorea leprosula]|uniref:Uncharacterized protein n=1 Tax=Rubroshorea leprosula TaxID=152421 RepID=A0AAV5MPY7_9ROSI|nr:hypothetical protein SLEP1_g58310 [Rubroshorea leprosula]